MSNTTITAASLVQGEYLNQEALVAFLANNGVTLTEDELEGLVTTVEYKLDSVGEDAAIAAILAAIG